VHYLLAIDTSGNVVLVDVDQGVRMPIGRPLAPSQHSQVTCAVWSGAGQWTAWSVDSDAADGVRELRFHDEETDVAAVLAESTTAFYLCSSPCGRYLSHLSLGPLGLELGVTDVRSGELWVIERGQPLFWSWSPDGEKLAVHVENRVLIADSSGQVVRSLSDDAGPFTTPWWLPGGSIAFAVEDRIVGGGLDGTMSALVAGHTAGRFSLCPDGRRLAHVEVTGAGLRLVVVDLLTGMVQEVTSRPTAGFFWSPAGDRLAVLVVTSSRQLAWLVFGGSEVVELPPFRPTRTWAGVVLPFFEQYAQSHQFWSVDGTRLVAPAIDDAGESGALVQEVAAPHRLLWLPDIEMAWWA
jgi:TolB protein